MKIRIAAWLFLGLTGVLVLSYYLPHFYSLVRPHRDRAPIVFFSPVKEEFLFLRSQGGETVRVDAAGQPLAQEDFEALLPLNFSSQLDKEGRLPATVQGREITAAALREGRFNLRLNPQLFDSPQIRLYPLLESDSGRVRLQMPDDFMRVQTGIEFVDAAENRVDHEKSEIFAKAFKDAGFQMPVGLVGGNPTTLKPYDEGYFLTDAGGSLFHLKQKRGLPLIHKIPDPAEIVHQSNFQAVGIIVQEQETQEFRALLIGDGNRIVFLLGPDYRMAPVDFEDFNPRTMQLFIRGDMLYRILTVVGETHLESVVVDRDFQVVDRYREPRTPPRQQEPGKLATLLFPIQFLWESPHSLYLGWNFEFGEVPAWFLWGIISAVFLVSSWKFARKRKIGFRGKAP